MVVRYFGEIADRIGRETEALNLERYTIGEVREYLAKSYNLSSEGLRIAVNHQLVKQEEDLELNADDEIAILSPFAGG